MTKEYLKTVLERLFYTFTQLCFVAAVFLVLAAVIESIFASHADKWNEAFGWFACSMAVLTFPRIVRVLVRWCVWVSGKPEPDEDAKLAQLFPK